MYTIIGSGRVARHFAFYFQALGLRFNQWSRRLHPEPVSGSVTDSSHVLILISDSSIEPFIQAHPELHSKTCVHFSGSLTSDLAFGAHPLMTFTEKLYDSEVYPGIPFVLEEGRGTFDRLLPGLPNPHYSVSPELKPLYHALCVLSGNFTSILWEKLFVEMEKQLGLPAHAAYPYLERICLNLKDRGIPALTGPLARRDLDTIGRNLLALKDDPFEHVYRGFLKAMDLPEGETDRP